MRAKLDKDRKTGILGKRKRDSFVFIPMLLYVIHPQTGSSQNHSGKKIEHTDFFFIP